MDINLQLYTGGCIESVCLDTRSIVNKINKVLKKTKISCVFIGWNKDVDLSEILRLLRDNDVDVYLWLPVFSELDVLEDFTPLIGYDCEKIEVSFEMGNNEHFTFYCPLSATERVIKIYEECYSGEIFNGVFLDKIRYPSFIGGINSVLGCYCDTCKASYDLPKFSKPLVFNAINPLGIVSYEDLRYQFDCGFKKLFDYKNDAIYQSLKKLCAYFRNKGIKIGFDLFAPFLACFLGQDYHRLLELEPDIVKPMFYGATNGPGGLPFEIDMYAKAFDDDPNNAQMRKEVLLDCIGYSDVFISEEIAGIKKIIKSNRLETKLYAGIELNYIEHYAPVTEKYIRESIGKIPEADGIVASWDLNTIPDSHIDYLLDSLEGM